jgi:hypothetical protein
MLTPNDLVLCAGSALQGPFTERLQVSDAPAVPEANLMEETMARRLLPGEGAARVRDVIDVLCDGGCAAPVGVEVFSTELAALPSDQAIQQVAEATRAVLGRT